VTGTLTLTGGTDLSTDDSGSMTVESAGELSITGDATLNGLIVTDDSTSNGIDVTGALMLTGGTNITSSDGGTLTVQSTGEVVVSGSASLTGMVAAFCDRGGEFNSAAARRKSPGLTPITTSRRNQIQVHSPASDPYRQVLPNLVHPADARRQRKRIASLEALTRGCWMQCSDNQCRLVGVDRRDILTPLWAREQRTSHEKGPGAHIAVRS
jgi:hypothetical protein